MKTPQQYITYNGQEIIKSKISGYYSLSFMTYEEQEYYLKTVVFDTLNGAKDYINGSINQQ